MSVQCPYCHREFPGEKLNARHLSNCNPDTRVKVPSCLCGHESTSLTQMKRHRKGCPVWQARDVSGVKRERMKTTSLERYGVEDASQTPEVRSRRAATNLERYGASNPFCKDASTFEKVQAAAQENRVPLMGEDNPFSKPEVKAKIKETLLERYGVDNPQRSAQIRASTRATNLERYGVEEPLSSPVMREAIRATCERVYGGPAPSCSPEIVEKARQTNLTRYGVDWTNQDPVVRAKQLETMTAKYGSHFFASEEGKKVIRGVMQERYGVDFWMQTEGAWDRLVETFRQKYGVDHPLQLEEFRAKQRQTNIDRYGWDYFINSTAFVVSCLSNAGVPLPDDLPRHPMMCREYAAKHLERMTRPGPNLLEQRVGRMAPSLMFTGDGKFWRWLPKLGHHKNPDFILPGPEEGHPKRGVTKVVEVFGDFWHSKMFTGKAPFEHEQELIAAYAEVGISCFVLWESEVKGDPQGTAERVWGFLC